MAVLRMIHGLGRCSDLIHGTQSALNLEKLWSPFPIISPPAGSTRPLVPEYAARPTSLSSIRSARSIVERLPESNRLAPVEALGVRRHQGDLCPLVYRTGLFRRL